MYKCYFKYKSELFSQLNHARLKGYVTNLETEGSSILSAHSIFSLMELDSNTPDNDLSYTKNGPKNKQKIIQSKTYSQCFQLNLHPILFQHSEESRQD